MRKNTRLPTSAMMSAGLMATTTKSADSYTVKHAWSEPGTYQVVLGVTTYVCTDGSPVQEDVSKTVSVQVQPAG